jgi:hypothetical protein
VLSGKPILAVLHQASTAVGVIRSANTGIVLAYDGEAELSRIKDEFIAYFQRFQEFLRNFDPRQVDLQSFEPYSAKGVTAALALLLEKYRK